LALFSALRGLLSAIRISIAGGKLDHPAHSSVIDQESVEESFMATPANASADANSATLTKNQVALLLQVSPRTIERLVSTGRLSALKLSSKIIRFRRTAIETFMDSTRSAFFVPKSRQGDQP
jgi:excisionase family DNA binding protein